ncbi:MAG TPA: AsnC family transcriptional regulator, partial [Dehalococcoidia bacterium]|nr:AsnC family transcriptional regulator [Dehalococcoidia bacterium]
MIEEESVVRGYVLIETDVGSAKAVGAAATELTYPGANVLAVDTVTGPYDVIVQLE